MDQYIGKLLDNRYEILELIGAGGMARVYKARCHRLNRLVAIKILREDLARDAEFRRRFHDESQAVAMLSHPNIVAVYDVSHSDNLDYIVMELIDGITLKQYMQSKGNILNWREALHFITQITKALGHAHGRGIIHRDIKPHNIMVLRDGSVKVADFGIARLMTAGHSTMTQEALGSVHYISPEQARGSSIDARSDLYSAGVVLYEMLTGRLPFEGDTPVSVAIQHINSIPLSPRELNPDIPEALEAITMRAMASNPNHRYSSADDMLEDLEEFRKNPDISFDYGPFVLESPDLSDEPTQIVDTGAINSSIRRGRRSSTRDRYEDDEEDYDEEEEDNGWMPPLRRRAGSASAAARKSSMRQEQQRRNVIAIAAILIFVVAIFAVIWFTVLSGIFKGNEPAYEVPDLTGHTLEDLQLDPTLLGENAGLFVVEEGESVADPNAVPGVIVEQEPKAKEKVRQEGDDPIVITVHLSAGPEAFEMPDLKNKEYREARIQLEGLGLEVATPEYDHSDEIARNYIISFTPLEGAMVKPGDTVYLVVSLGKESKPVTLPSFAKMTLERAKSDLDFMNLEFGGAEEVYDDNVPAGQVVSQYPAANTVVEEGSSVKFQVSKGPDPSTVAPPSPSQPTPQTKAISVDLPAGDGTVHVVITVDGTTAYDQMVERSQGTISPQITGTEIQQVTIYFDGVQYASYPYDFT